MALKLANLFGTTSEFRMNLQSNYDLHKIYVKQKEEIEKVKKIA